jgi:hypothetical protein
MADDAGKPGPADAGKLATADAAAAPTCGKKPLPPCPLQGWMQGNMQPPMQAQDFAGLASALDRSAALQPPGYGNWASIARDGARAARDQNLDGVKASCKSCHGQYQDRYRKEMRARKI